MHDRSEVAFSHFWSDNYKNPNFDGGTTIIPILDFLKPTYSSSLLSSAPSLWLLDFVVKREKQKTSKLLFQEMLWFMRRLEIDMYICALHVR